MAEEDATNASTQGVSLINYGHVILFMWHISKEYPFSVTSLAHFKGSDFPFNVINGPLSDEDRQIKHKLTRLQGQDYSVFCKIEQSRVTNA